MVGWLHRLKGHEFESTLGVGDGQGGLACCSLRSHKESDTTYQLKRTELSDKSHYLCDFTFSFFTVYVEETVKLEKINVIKF